MSRFDLRICNCHVTWHQARSTFSHWGHATWKWLLLIIGLVPSTALAWSFITAHANSIINLYNTAVRKTRLNSEQRHNLHFTPSTSAFKAKKMSWLGFKNELAVRKTQLALHVGALGVRLVSLTRTKKKKSTVSKHRQGEGHGLKTGRSYIDK